MGRLRVVIAMLVVVVMGTRTGVTQGKTHLDAVLAQMDAASAKFQSAEADFQWDFFERVTRSTSTQAGTIFFHREKKEYTEMGAKIVTPDVKFVSFNDNKLQVFDPKANTLLKINTVKNGAQVESFLTLGFGGSGRDLEKAWTIEDLGMETIDGVSAAKLNLVSKDQNVRNMFTHVTIWVDLGRDVLLRQEAYTPSEDKRTAIFRNIRYNVKIDRRPYAINPNSKTNVTNR